MVSRRCEMGEESRRLVKSNHAAQRGMPASKYAKNAAISRGLRERLFVSLSCLVDNGLVQQ